jgi:glycosyltransferase involved in cell wall biosynthesis
MQQASNLARPFSEKPARLLDVLVVDPGGFSIKYDYALCQALSQSACNVTLVSSEYRHAHWDVPTSFELWKHFYRRAHGDGSESGGVGWKLAKAAEHAGDMKRLAELVERRRPDVVHFQWLPLPMVDAVYLPRMAAVAPLVLTIHNTTIFHGTPTSRLQGLGFRSALKTFSAFIAHARYSKDKMIRQGWAPDEQIVIIPHGAFEQGDALPVVTQNKGEKEVLFLGSIRPYKAPDVLIRAFAKLPQQVRQTTRLTIAGKPGMDLAPLFRLADELGITDRISWVPRYLPEEEARAMYRSATIVALPFREIDQSGALLNAIGWGKPLVATAIGGVSETIQDGVNGLLVPPDDVDAFSSALLRLLTSPDLRTLMRTRLLALAGGDLSWGSVATKTQQLYSSLVSRKGDIQLAPVPLH